MLETEIQNLTAEIKKLRVALSGLNMPSTQTFGEAAEEIQATKDAETEQAPSQLVRSQLVRSRLVPSHDDIKAMMLKLSRESDDGDIKSKIKGILKVHGANKIQDLQVDQLPKVKTDLEELS